ncbi:M20 peptidase aminoacylase family protein [Neobacillus mesonae]|uniref:M20 peptidase aminoacylase family protein n=1 Tax=Neobacillus mesonae TaxID=1193713 RepID=UPI0020417064|nr:M20 peptidase aminoacylase family protein [Neobacillus mesonae]MCM3567718.1 M20 peptidase aminoacylase family protein [Neobacillus mesonae]
MKVKETDKQEVLFSKLVAYRRELHENPELSFKEFETTKRIRQWLKEEGITILDYPLEVGVIAEVSGAKPGPTIALRADIDALPIKEETNLPFASKNDGVMHACGHDFHTASILGSAILLQERKSELNGTVRIIFQPAEEVAQGAVAIDKAGVLEGVEAIFGMHNKPDLPVGTIGVREGSLMASVDRFEIDVIGVGGHAGIPNNSVDPIVAASQIVSALQTIVSRNISSFHNAVISVTRIQGGNTWNVIPEKVQLEGTVRTFQNEARELIPELMKRTSEGVASGFGAKADFRWYPYLPVVVNHAPFSQIMKETAEELGYTVVEASPSPAGEDFAFYQTKIPGFFVWMGVDGPQEWHHPAFMLKEEALPIAANYFADLSIKVLNQWK